MEPRLPLGRRRDPGPERRGVHGAATTAPIAKPTAFDGGVESGQAEYYALAINSATAVRTLNSLLGSGLTAKLALAQFTTPGGRTFPAGHGAVPVRPGDEEDARRRRARSRAPAAARPRHDAPARATSTARRGSPSSRTRSTRASGRCATSASPPTRSGRPRSTVADRPARWTTTSSSARRAGRHAANATARARLTAFFAAGGGYIGGGANGAGFLTTGAQVTGLTAGDAVGGNGRSGIVYWNNTGGVNSPITGAYPAQDTAIVDPPTWLTVDPGRLDGRRQPAAGRLLRGGPLADRRAVGGRTRRTADHARPQHSRHGADDGVRPESALPGGSGARVAGARLGRSLGRQVSTTAWEGRQRPSHASFKPVCRAR